MNIQTLKEASDCLLNLAKPETQPTEYILLQDAFERILAEDITAKIPVPSFAKSAYDGYALRHVDTAAASPEHPVTLDVTEVIPAGSVPTCPITEGKAARIMTGAPVPEGADAIIMHERTSFTENTVTLTAPVTSANIIPPGEDVAAGTLLVPKGKILTASDLALIAGQGIAEIRVYKKLSIGLISTGSELLNTGSPLEYGKIYNTNPYLLGGYIQKHHMTANYLNTVSDDLDSLCRAVLEALKTNDIVITTGGVSAGDFDYMPEVIRRIGGDLLFHRLKFKPGGAMLGALGFSFINILNNENTAYMHLSPIFVAIFSFCFAVTLGALWEIYEFSFDGLLGLNMQKFALENHVALVGREALKDTMKDIIVDCLGAFTVSLIGYISLRYKKGWYENFLIKIPKDNN